MDPNRYFLKWIQIRERTLRWTRLRIMLADDKKDKNKLEIKHKKDMDSLKVSKISLEEELRTSAKENHDLKENKEVLMNIVKLLTGKLNQNDGGNNEDISRQLDTPENIQSNGAQPKYGCDKCEFIGGNNNELIKHQKDVHLENLTITFPCDKCETQFKSLYDLNTHKKTHKQVSGLKCHECDFFAKSKVNLKKHNSPNSYNILMALSTQTTPSKPQQARYP